MRHAGQVDGYRRAADILAESQRQLGGRFFVGFRRQKFAQVNHLAGDVGKLDADDAAPRHDGDAHGNRAHGTRDVVTETDDPGCLGARRRLQFIKGDDGTRAHLDDFAADSEILQDTAKELGVLLKGVVVERVVGAPVRPFVQ